MADRKQLEEALRRWVDGDREALLTYLGYRFAPTVIPETARPDFGLHRDEGLELCVLATSGALTVLHIRLEARLAQASIRDVAERLYRKNPARRALLLFDDIGCSRLVIASWGLGPGPLQLRKLWIDPRAPRPSELEILADVGADETRTVSELALAHARALDREGLTRRFFDEFRRHRGELADALTGVSGMSRRDRLDLALTLMSRLLFLYFIQAKGWLCGDLHYLRNLYAASLRDGAAFYRRRLKPLFFAALNRPSGHRSESALQLGELPYLNGGLFERTDLERRHPRLDIPDEAFGVLLRDLLDRYQFTLRESQPLDQDVAVDPEMLGRVFEGLMAAEERGSSGAFYTPRQLVRRLVHDTLAGYLAESCRCPIEPLSAVLAGDESTFTDLAAPVRRRLLAGVRSVRVLDPAVGSGAFLLAALLAIERLLEALERQGEPCPNVFERRAGIIRRNLHGVDINASAVSLCELRLWLALIVDLEVARIADVPALPNLDINVRQGDALLDPIDFVSGLAGLEGTDLIGIWRGRARALSDHRARYFEASGVKKRRLARSLRQDEHGLALDFLVTVRSRLVARRADLRALERSSDLFGERTRLDTRQARALAQIEARLRDVRNLIRRLRRLGQLPFFSFAIHFATPKRPSGDFDVIVGNPPWVRVHRWASLSRERLKARFRFLRCAGWKRGARLAGAGRGFGAQLDLSALFLERSLDLLARGGTLGFILPAKLLRALYGSGARSTLIRDTRLLSLEDHSLSGTRLFGATTYPMSLMLCRSSPDADSRVKIDLHTRSEIQHFNLLQRDLPLMPNDRAAPWVLAHPSVAAAVRRMRAVGPPLGEHPGRAPGRGIVTGANAIFIGSILGPPREDELVSLSIDGETVELEGRSLRPLLRGEDIEPWAFRVNRALVWPHDGDGRVLARLPSATRRYLEARTDRLKSRSDLKPGQPAWSLFRVHPSKWSRRVVWRDIGKRPTAAVVPDQIAFLGRESPVVSLNTLYQIPAESDDDAHFLCSILNSRVAAAYLSSFAERASGGHFRYLGWTMALLPLPSEPHPDLVASCSRLSRRAHELGEQPPKDRRQLDALVGRLYGLDSDEVATLIGFQAELEGAI